MAALGEVEIAKRYGLASVVFRDVEPGWPEAIGKTDGLVAIDAGLAAVCGALGLSPRGLGGCWRDDTYCPLVPQLKIVLWGAARFGEEGDYAPACGTINLFGSVSSLLHEVGHAIDFQLNQGDTPWSHGEVWARALGQAPEFCEHVFPTSKRRGRGRVRLSDLYFAAPHEMFARVFECFVVDRCGVELAGKPDCSSVKAYPQGLERAVLCDVIDREVVAQLCFGKIAATTNPHV